MTAEEEAARYKAALEAIQALGQYNSGSQAYYIANAILKETTNGGVQSNRPTYSFPRD